MPRWLAFLNAEMDLLWELPPDYAYQAIPNNKLAPNLARRDIRMEQVPALDLTFNYFNMEDPIVGGFEPHKVALRRAISVVKKRSGAHEDTLREMRLGRGGVLLGDPLHVVRARARRDRPGLRPQHPDPGRGHLVDRHRDRAAHPEGARCRRRRASSGRRRSRLRSRQAPVLPKAR